jgi:sugar transferase (PEP-CTERM/EpsH1 system associated)
MSAKGDLLYLAHRVPYPPDKGEKIRAYHVLKHLAENFRVHLGCFADDPADEQHTAPLKEICASVLVLPLNRKAALARGLLHLMLGGCLSEAYFRDARMTRFVSGIVHRTKPQAMFLYCSAMAPYAMPYASSCRVLLDMVDVDSEKYRAYSRNAAWPLSMLYAKEAQALFGLERRAALAFERSFFVSKAEADTFLRNAPEAAERVGYFHNGVDLNYFNPARDFPNPFGVDVLPIVFTGTMDYRPNVEAVTWFAEQVFADIRRHHAKAEFWIVGANPAPRVLKLAKVAGIRVTGRVADVRPYLKHARCVVAPLHIARGVQNKVLEAMAMAKAVVATEAACEGISAAPGTELLVAQDPAAFAAAVFSVLNGQARNIAHTARARVEADYEWTSNLQMLDGLLADGRRKVNARQEGRASQTAGAALGIAS